MSDARIGDATLAKVSRRLIPFMVAMFCVSFLDRVNIGFAALTMSHDLGLMPEAYGFAAGILFVSYTAFEIPSNLILDRVGPRLWLARIMITWGVIAAAGALVFDRYSLYLMRFVLGAAEAGLFPGLMLYISRWFPAPRRGRAIALFMAGSPVSVVVGAPASTALLSLGGWVGLKGWQWLFVLEGLPAVMLGLVALYWLTDRPQDALWLSAAERAWLCETMALEERARQGRPGPAGVLAVFAHGPTLLLALSKFCVLLAFFGVTLWLPQIIRSFGHITRLETGFLTALPYACAAIGSILAGRACDRSGRRGRYVAIPAFVGALGFVGAAFTGNPAVAMVALCVAATGLWISNTLFWTIPTALLAGTSAAAGLALINSVGNLGGFFGPTLTGWVRAGTGSYTWALSFLGGFLAVSGLLALIVGRHLQEPPPADSKRCRLTSRARE